MRISLILLGLALSIYSCSNFLGHKNLPYHVSSRMPASEEFSLNANAPISTPEELEVEYKVTPVSRLEKARIVYVDYELVRRDFPALKEKSNPEIDDWLLNNAAFMARTQVEQAGANSVIPTTKEKRVAYRPKDYGRALVFPAESLHQGEEEKLIQEVISDLQHYFNPLNSKSFSAQEIEIKNKITQIKSFSPELGNQFNEIFNGLSTRIAGSNLNESAFKAMKSKLIDIEKAHRSFLGLIDAKGVGAVLPRAGDHSDGLMTLGESIREFAYEKLVSRIFIHDGQGLKTVGSYAVIDAGTSVKHADGSSSPAGIILRQAHTRYDGPSSTMSDKITLKVEKVLRRYGLTSAGAYRNKYDYDKLNVQGTKKGAVIDFGGFLALENFGGREARHFFRTPTLYKDSGPKRVTIDENVRVPLEQWGTTISGKEDPKMDNPWLWSHELARDFAEGRANRDDAYNHLRNLWGPVFEKLEANPNQRSKSCHDLVLEILQ